MQFDEAGTLFADVKFFFADDNAKTFAGPHHFGNGRDFQEHQLDALGPGEYWNSLRDYYNGANDTCVVGQGSPCGPLDWWLNGVPSDAPPLVIDPWGVPICCPGCHGISGTVPFWYNGHHPAKITLLPRNWHYSVSQGPFNFTGTFTTPSGDGDDVIVFTTIFPTPGHPAPMLVTWVSSVFNAEVEMDPCDYDPATGTSVWRTSPGSVPCNPYRIVIVYPEH